MYFLLLLHTKIYIRITMFRLPQVTKNILIINLIVFILDYVMESRYGIEMIDYLGLHFVTSQDFQFWQPLTYMFMHADFSHIFFNMFAVLMFGPALEERWGSRRYLIYYLIAGLGAAFVQEAYWAISFNQMDAFSASVLSQIAVTIGASGSVFGILLAFGWFFPEVRMFLLFVPVPIRARTMVLIYALIELFSGVAPIQGDNVAHFAHLGGMIFGWIIILLWRWLKVPGFDAPGWGIGTWLKEKWEAIFGKRHPHIKRDDDDSKDYRDYHYHSSL